MPASKCSAVVSPPATAGSRIPSIIAVKVLRMNRSARSGSLPST